MIKSIKILFIFTLFSITNSISFAQQSDDAILRAMRDEINRNMNNLKLETLQKPYYIEYKLRLRQADRVVSNLGKTVESGSTKFAQLSVEVRIGDYKFDNTNFFDVGLSFFGSSDDEESFKNRKVQFELDYNALRRELWLATDAAYKQSSEIYTKKESSLKSRMRRDSTPDFMPVEAQKNYRKNEFPKFDFKYFENLANKLSEVFINFPDIFKSSVGIEYIPEDIYYVNSEGIEYIKTEYQTGIEIAAFTQADDGMPLNDFFTAYSQEPEKLPKLDSLINAAKDVASNLSKLRIAPFLEESYSGPVIFEDQAASEVLAQVFLPNLVAQRSQMSEGGVQQPNRFQAFQTKIGGRVLPEFLSVMAKPLAENFDNTQLIGNFEIDDNGLLTNEVLLIDNGYLKTLLSERIPTKRIKNSNAHKRGGAAMLSNMFINSSKEKQLTKDELKSKMISLCKDRELPFGLVVRKITNQNLMFTTLFRLAMGSLSIPRGEGAMSLVRTYKVYPDGSEELIRGSEVSSFAVASFKDIIHTGNKNYAYNYLSPSVISPFMSSGDQYVGVSIITPDLLFEDVEVKSSDEDFKKPPILSNPISEKK